MPHNAQIRNLLASLILLPLIADASDVGEPKAGEDIIGTVGEMEVGIDEVRRHLQTLGEEEREALRQNPEALGQYVRALLVQQLVLREALAAGWEKSAAVAERMGLVREGVIANTWIESKAALPDGYPSENEVEIAYNTNRENFLQPKSWRLAQIFISAPKPSAGEQEPTTAMDKLKRVSADLKENPAGFAELAANESDDPASAAEGGEIGWLPEPRIHPEIRAALPQLKLGSVSDPIRMDDGWHIVRVLDIREPYIPTLEQIRETLAEQLRTERTKYATEAYLGKMLRENPIAINEVALSKLLRGGG